MHKAIIGQLQNNKWEFPVNPSLYDRGNELSKAEKAEISFVVQNASKWHSRTHQVLDRLVRPLHDVLDITKAMPATRAGTTRVIIVEMNMRQTSFWAWSESDWKEIFGYSATCFYATYNVPKDCRIHLICIVYLLCNFNNHRPAGSQYHAYSVATKVFGEELVNLACERIVEAYIKLGYGQDRSKVRLRGSICDLLLTNRSPYIEYLTIEVMKSLRNDDSLPEYIKRDLLSTSCALTSLGIISEPLKARLKDGERFGTHDATKNVPVEWLEWCQRWYKTSTLSPKTRQKDYYQSLKIGRWLSQKHPDIVNPEQWTRDLAIEFVATVDKMKVGEWAENMSRIANNIGKPLSPRAKDLLLGTARRFFRDCQEYGWIKRHFNPERAFATPLSIRALISPEPRVIADDTWAKLLWAGLNLTEKDLPHSHYQGPNNRVSWYPLEMVKAIVIVWLFAGLRSDEIYRLKVGCVRWQKNDLTIPSTDEVITKDAVCYLDIPVHKTGNAYTKPVDRLVGEAIEDWEKVRPNQPQTIDRKDGSLVHYLFFYRGRKVGQEYINDSIIPMLCRKAGVPEKDTTGKITSHRARSTIASQLANTREPMTLLELKEWLGHRDVNSTINYTKVSPTKLAKSYQDADYFKRNIRTIEVLIDQNAVKTGAAANGESWIFYDLGHGYCTYDFFDQCKHRMACAKCNFYVPKDSSKAQILESKTNLQRMLQEIPLSEEERAAVEEGIEAMSILSAKLVDEPTPFGKTPRELGNA